MDENIYMKKIITLVDEMGEERLIQYMKVYLQCGYDKKYFFQKFGEYIDSNKKLSIHGFKIFILDRSLDNYIDSSLQELGEITNKCWENKRKAN